MNITQENFLLNRKAFYLKELSELKDKEIEILENINTLDSILSTYEDEPAPKTELPLTNRIVSIDQRTIEVSISEEKEGEDKDKFYDQIIEIVKCLLDLIKPPIVESFFVEQETEKCTESFLTGLAESMFSGDPFKEETTVTNSNTTYFSDYIIGLYPIEKESDESPKNLEFLKENNIEQFILDNYGIQKCIEYCTLADKDKIPFLKELEELKHDPCTSSNPDNYIGNLAILEERKIQEKIREEENEKDNKLLSILERLTKAFEKYVNNIK